VVALLPAIGIAGGISKGVTNFWMSSGGSVLTETGVRIRGQDPNLDAKYAPAPPVARPRNCRLVVMGSP
jgi:hypothetical protein